MTDKIPDEIYVHTNLSSKYPYYTDKYISEQKHAEEIAALKAEHRAEMAGLCDTFMRNASFLEDGDYEQLRKNVELIKQRISDE